MTSRSGWLLLGTALGIAGMPGCHCLNRHDDAQESNLAEFIPPPDPQPLQRIAKTMEPVRDEEGTQPQPKDVLPPVKPIPGTKDAEAPKADLPTNLAPLVLALQCVLDDRHQEALTHLRGYDAETQEFYLRSLPIITTLAKKRFDELTSAEVAVLNEQLQSLLVKLRPRTELVIDRMCCCAWIKNFGYYQPLPEEHGFAAPAPDRPGELVKLYVELRNFACVPRESCFETRLSSTIEIRDASGQKVFGYKFKDGDSPLSRLARLNDFNYTYMFRVPDLSPGTYQLVLQIADETIPDARRVAEKAIEFHITPAGTRVH